MSINDLPIEVIPKDTPYCYQIKGVQKRKNSAPLILTELCPYWQKHGHQNGYCAYLGYDDQSLKGFGTLSDQVKECGISYGDEGCE